MWSLYILIPISLLLGIGAWLLFMWSLKKNQYDDIEGPKYRMLLDDDDDDKVQDNSQIKTN